MIEIKRCPFCGGRAHIYNSPASIWWYACDKCRAETRAASTKTEALEIWNRRASSAEAGLRKALEEIAESESYIGIDDKRHYFTAGLRARAALGKGEEKA